MVARHQNVASAVSGEADAVGVSTNQLTKKYANARRDISREISLSPNRFRPDFMTFAQLLGTASDSPFSQNTDKRKKQKLPGRMNEEVFFPTSLRFSAYFRIILQKKATHAPLLQLCANRIGRASAPFWDSFVHRVEGISHGSSSAGAPPPAASPRTAEATFWCLATLVSSRAETFQDGYIGLYERLT